MALKLIVTTIVLGLVLIHCESRHVGSQRVPELDEIESKELAKRSYKPHHYRRNQLQEIIHIEAPKQSHHHDGINRSEEQTHNQSYMANDQIQHMSLIESEESMGYNSQEPKFVKIDKVYHNTDTQQARNGQLKTSGLRSRSHQDISQESNESEAVLNKIYKKL